MADKSPRQSMSKKSDQSLKQKRTDKKAKSESSSHSAIEKLTPPRKR